MPLYTHQILDQEAIFKVICHGFHRLRTHRPEWHLHKKFFQQVDAIDSPIVLEISAGVSNVECGNMVRSPEPVVASPGVDSISLILNRSKRPHSCIDRS